MSKKNGHGPETIVTSIRFPKDFHDKLMEKSRDLGHVSLAKTCQYLWQRSEMRDAIPPNDFGILAYAVMEELVFGFVKDPQRFMEKAIKRSKKLVTPSFDFQEEDTAD